MVVGRKPGVFFLNLCQLAWYIQSYKKTDNPSKIRTDIIELGCLIYVTTKLFGPRITSKWTEVFTIDYSLRNDQYHICQSLKRVVHPNRLDLFGFGWDFSLLSFHFHNFSSTNFKNRRFLLFEYLQIYFIIYKYFK